MRRLLPVLSSVCLLPTPVLAAPQTGTIVIQGAPDGQPVQIDGAPVGTTPLPGPWTLPSGRHEVRIGERAQTVNIPAGKRVDVAYGAAPKPKAAPKARTTVRTASRVPVATLGYIGAGIGLAAVGAGVFFGTQSSDDPSEQERAAVLANIGYGIGGVLIAGGAAMIIWGSDGPFSASVTPGGAVIGGRF